MKQRDLYWVNQIFIFLIITVFFGIVSILNVLQFNASYMQEEQEELKIFKRQIEWAIKPILQQKNNKLLQKYCDDFKDEDVEIRIFDENKKLLASSNLSNKSDLIDKNSKIFNKNYSKFMLYKYATRDKKIGIREKIFVDNHKYYLELTVSQAYVMKSIIAAQKSAVTFFVICIFLFIIGLIQVFSKLRNAFNELEDSVIEVANGNLDCEIKIPKIDLLKELTLSIKKMVKRLKIQIARLTQLEKYKSEFLQNITHEIKTPITAINSAIELIETRSSIDEIDKECFDIIQFQIKSIDKLVNDILCLSELEVAKTAEDKNFGTFNLNKMIEKVIDEFNYTDIKINFIQSEKVMFSGDKDLLSIAVSNLLSNAIKYSGTETIDIILNKHNEKIELFVKDYGVGIKKECLNHIFEKFFRVDKNRSRKLGGSGLGLSIVKNIIELHKGTISVKSEINKETSFKISFNS